ncbi:MAG: hypothetical protein KatS3mg078_1319 [Deltaproteobacteria bacterium]|nr:MAG: hypothetical protein KatS3mg078_1319 [Deltaproteobacteria bacterium]
MKAIERVERNKRQVRQGLDADRERYLRGIELYRSGKVEIGPDGMFYVNGYRVSPDEQLIL